MYISRDENGDLTVPRVGIPTVKGRIAEVRGVSKAQEIDPYIVDVLEKKLKDFPDGSDYMEKLSDMKKLTDLWDRITKENTVALTEEEIIFLYQIERNIKSFGYRADPRIQECIGLRKDQHDLSANIADKMIDSDNVLKLIEHIDSFEMLPASTAEKLIDAGYGEDVVNCINSFEGVNLMSIAHRLVDTHQEDYVRSNMHLFKGFDLKRALLERKIDSTYENYRIKGVDTKFRN